MKKQFRHIGAAYSNELLLGIYAIPVGIIIGLLDTIFGRILLELSAIRDNDPLHFIPFLPLAGILIAFCYIRFGGKSSRGMNLVFEVGHGEEEVIPLRLIPFVTCGTWITHLFGGSAGREGVAVQIGATFSHWAGKYFPLKNSSEIFLVTGMAAGFSGLFQTPFAAVVFALEVLSAGELRYKALFPALTASVASAFTSRYLGLEKFSFSLTDTITFDAETLIKLIAAGIIFGIAGGMFAWTLKKAKEFAGAKIKNPVLRIALMGLCLSLLLILLFRGRYSGLGTNLISLSFSDAGTVYYWDWLCKFALTVLTLSAGFQGGEVTPLFSIGSSLGYVISGFLGLPVFFTAALGYAAVFGSATNTLFAAVFIGAEVFGFEYFPYFFIVCSAAYVFNMNKSIYTLQTIKR